MTSELTVYMLPHRYEVLNRALYGDEHGSGQRTLDLEMISGQKNLDIKLPVLCMYENNLLCLNTKIDKDDWLLLCNIVAIDGKVKVVFDDGKRDYLAKLTLSGAKPPKDGGLKIKLRWKEIDDAKITLEKSVRWIKRILK
jgi:hypothetical protein